MICWSRALKKKSFDKVIQHVEAATLQNFVNTDFVRFITKVDRDRLVLRVPPLLKGGERVTQELVWGTDEAHPIGSN
jgi:hypothetical protein